MIVKSRAVALISMLVFLASSCSSASLREQDSKDERVSSGQEVAAVEDAAAEEMTVEEEERGSCEDIRVQYVARQVHGLESSQSTAREELARQCSINHNDALRPFECSCEVLEEFLHASEAAAQWAEDCCEKSTMCSREGRCAPRELEGDVFIDRLYEAARVAMALGQIGLSCERPVCDVTEVGCRQSDQCARAGNCGVDQAGRCRPMTESHCEKSEYCRDSARCKLDAPGQSCRLDCSHPSMCEENGYCSYDEHSGRCEVTESSHCEESVGCIEEGRCTLESLEEYEDRSWNMGEPPRGCYSKVDRAVSEAQDNLDESLKTAMTPLVRMALQEEDG